MSITPQDVRLYLGRDPAGSDDAGIMAHVEAATQMVKAYVRGNGFDDYGPAEDLEAVIVSFAARLHSNPTNDTQTSVSVDDASESRSTFRGWTLPELAVMHRYRVRAW